MQQPLPRPWTWFNGTYISLKQGEVVWAFRRHSRESLPRAPIWGGNPCPDLGYGTGFTRQRIVPLRGVTSAHMRTYYLTAGASCIPPEELIDSESPTSA